MLLLSAPAPAQQEGTQPPSTVKDVMMTMTIPASDAIFAAASEPPQNDEQWAALSTRAAVLAESGRLLMSGTRKKDDTTWMERARALVDQAEAFLKVAGTKKEAALEDAGNEVYATCEACHERYLDPGK